jgi:Tfp pilus assembly protein PilF
MEVPMKLASSLLVLGAISFAAMSALADMGKDAAPLKAAAGSKAESHIAAGIEHYGKGHWDVAKKHFSEAEKADPQSAEAHYDLALALDKSGDHKSATEHFQRAAALGKDNSDIQQSEILKKHLKM